MKNQDNLWKTLEQKSKTPAALFLKEHQDPECVRSWLYERSADFRRCCGIGTGVSAKCQWIVPGKSAQFAMANDTPGNCNPYGKWIKVTEETPVDCPYPETYLDAVGKNGALLEYVPPEEQTAAVALAAVSQRPDALLWVLDQTDEVCKKAIAGKASAAQWIRDEGQKSRLEKKNTPTM